MSRHRFFLYSWQTMWKWCTSGSSIIVNIIEEKTKLEHINIIVMFKSSKINLIVGLFIIDSMYLREVTRVNFTTIL